VEWVTTGVALTIIASREFAEVKEMTIPSYTLKLTIIASREFAEVKEMTIPSYTLKDFAPMQTSYSSSKI